MSGAPALSGRTRVIAIVGDPIAQVKSPAGVTAALNATGRDCVVVPMHVTAADFAAFVRGATVAKNVDALIATVPHKFAAFKHCAATTPRAATLGAVNVMRRATDATWFGDMVDGTGFVASAHAGGCVTDGARALLVGAGGAGSAIALALLDAGVAHLAIHDGDTARRDALVGRMNAVHPGRCGAGSPDPRGFGMVVNATPAGMREGDPLPVDAAGFAASMFVADVITAPSLTPLLAAAQRAGCPTRSGVDMFNAVAQRMIEFLIEAGPLAQLPR